MGTLIVIELVNVLLFVAGWFLWKRLHARRATIEDLKVAFEPREPMQDREQVKAAAGVLEEVVETQELGPLAKLPPFAPVAIRLLKQFDREDAEVAEVAKLVAADPALVSEILAVSNSALFSPVVPVTEPRHAVIMLGTGQTRAMAATFAMRALLKDAPKTPVVRRIWKHCLASAVVAEELAPIYGVSKDLAHTAAVLHDVGRMGMLSAYRDAYEALAVRSLPTVAAILDEEREQFGMDHCQAGSRLCRSWQLPREFAEAAAHHHELPADHSILALVQLSCRLAEAIGYVAITHEEIDRPLAIIHHFAPQSFRERAEELLGSIQSRALEETEKFEF